MRKLRQSIDLSFSRFCQERMERDWEPGNMVRRV